MRPWAEWTAKTALVAAGFAAVGGGLSGSLALAATASGATLGNSSLLSDNRAILPAGIPADVCGNASGLLGIASAECQGGAKLADNVLGAAGVAPAAATSPAATTGSSPAGSSNKASTPASVPAAVCGAASTALSGSSAGCAGGATADRGTGTGGAAASALGTVDALAGLQPVTGLILMSGPVGSGGGLANSPGAGAAGGTSGLGSSQASGLGPAGPGAGNQGIPDSAQLVGLGTLPGLADLPSLAGLANLPALNGATGGGVPLPDTALTAANAAGMNSDSFAVLAIGSLLAGVSALKIASRRARDRKTGIGVTI